MFSKGSMRDQGIDITWKNNPDHVLAPDDQEMVRKVKLRKISPDEFKSWYKKLLQKRWETRKEEILEMVKLGKDKDIKLKCFCSSRETHCHAVTASEVLNGLISRLKDAKK